MSNEVLIKAEGVSKKFCRKLKKSLIYGGSDIIKGFLGRERSEELRKDEFWAVHDVNFEVKRGECLGLIGHNGAGKSTLLKMLNGLIRPDKGRIEMKGKVGALIELGAGFSPLLTGRENVYNNGAVLGFTKDEIDRKFDEIVEFAELNEFIDTPVQNYSSGMKVRLGFAVASHMKPDVLILDEVLAVGDASFRAKCYNQIGKLKENTATIFVSHAMQQISQICNKVMLLDKGIVKWEGNLETGVSMYNSFNAISNEARLILNLPIQEVGLRFQNLEINYGDSLITIIKIISQHEILNTSIRLFIYNTEGLIISEWNSRRNGLQFNLISGENTIDLSFGPIYLKAGNYKLGIALNDQSDLSILFWSYKENTLILKGNVLGASEYQLPLPNVNFNN
jgi:lipopolysaccharide transport system ATP-binding protein